MKQFLMSLALTTAMFATPSLAQTTSGSSTGSGAMPSGSDASSMMTCKDFSAMDATGQEQALQTMQTSMGSGSGAMSSDAGGSMKSGSADASGSGSSSSGTKDTMSSGSSGSSGSSTSGSMSSDSGGAMKSGSTDSSGSMASGGDMSAMSKKVMTYCQKNPGEMVSDAMTKSSTM